MYTAYIYIYAIPTVMNDMLTSMVYRLLVIQGNAAARKIKVMCCIRYKTCSLWNDLWRWTSSVSQIIHTHVNLC